MSDSCDIIIPVWNEKALTRDCMDRIKKHTGHPYRLIIIDNNSDNQTREYLKSEEKKSSRPFICIHNDVNAGFLKAVNQGFREAGSPYVCVLNNDTLVCRDWLADMIDILKNNKEIGIVNPSSNVLGQGPLKENIDDFAASIRGQKGLYQKMDFCRGFCMVFRKTLLDEIGFFDEVFGRGYFEEADFCRRAEKKGYISVRSKSSYVYHIDRATFRSVSNLSDLFNANKKIFYQRYGRPLWALFVIGDTRVSPGIIETINVFLKKGHRALICHARGAALEGIDDHINARVKQTGFPFYLSIFFRIIKRKKDKKYAAIFTDSRSHEFFKRSKFLHKTQVFKNNGKNSFLSFIDTLSFKHEG